MIETNNLTKYFGKADNVVKAVDGINIGVEGGVHGFLGPNGAGKSTTLKMLVGAINITNGDAKIKGNPVGTVKAKKLIGYLPEHPKFYNMDLFDYLIYMGRLGGLSKEKAKNNTMELIEWFDLVDAMERDVNDFSAGMKQKAGLAQALIHEPEILILDEPTANLDPLGRASVLDKIKTLAISKNITVFISSHILSEIEKISDNVTIINKGKVIMSEDMDNAKMKFSGNHYILKTSENEEVTNHELFKKFVKNFWIDKTGNLQIISEHDYELKKSLPNILVDSEAVLETFKQVELSLENVFLRVVSEGDN